MYIALLFTPRTQNKKAATTANKSEWNFNKFIHYFQQLHIVCTSVHT